MQERRDHHLFVDALACGQGRCVDPAQMVVGRFGDQSFDGIDGFRVGRLPQKRKHVLGFAHQIISAIALLWGPQRLPDRLDPMPCRATRIRGSFYTLALRHVINSA